MRIRHYPPAGSSLLKLPDLYHLLWMVPVNRREEDIKYMQMALDLARRGWPSVLLNPMVGALLVRDGEVIGQGWHRSFGEAHAEIEAIRSVKNPDLIRGATLFVSLEPCCHHGKTPPCADALIESGISRAVVASVDPNPLVSCRGIARLKEAGIEVEEGLLAESAVELNSRFYTYHLLKRPFVILKWAQTEDGFIARKDGSSKWISSEDSRTLVHRWRSEETAIMVGTNTACLDDPELTVRHVEGRNPLRVLIDPKLRVSPESRIFNNEADTFVINTLRSETQGNVQYIKKEGPRFDVSVILETLFQNRVMSCIVEGGQCLLQQFIDTGLWDEARVFTAEKSFAEGIKAPALLSSHLTDREVFSSGDTLSIYRNSGGAGIFDVYQSFRNSQLNGSK